MAEASRGSVAPVAEVVRGSEFPEDERAVTSVQNSRESAESTLFHRCRSNTRRELLKNTCSTLQIQATSRWDRAEVRE